jgi:hypothetical protein
MSFVPVFLNLLLAALLITALAVGVRLERRLKDLRKSHQSFSLAVQELNSASARAQAGLTQLRVAAQEAGDLLGNRIHQARELTDQLDAKMTAALELAKAPLVIPDPVVSPPATPKARYLSEPASRPAPIRSIESDLDVPTRSRKPAGFDDDLFDEPQSPLDLDERQMPGLKPAKPFGGRR